MYSIDGIGSAFCSDAINGDQRPFERKAMELHHYSSPSGSRRVLCFRKERRMRENSKSIGNRSIGSGAKAPDFKNCSERDSRMPRKSSESTSRGKHEKKRKMSSVRYEKRRDHRSSFSNYPNESKDRSNRKIRRDSISSEGPRSEDDNEHASKTKFNSRYLDSNQDKRRTNRTKHRRKIKNLCGRRNDGITEPYASANNNVDKQYNDINLKYSHEYEYPFQQMKSINNHGNYKDSPMRYSGTINTNAHRCDPKDRDNERDLHHDESRTSNNRRYRDNYSIMHPRRNKLKNRRGSRKRYNSPSTYKRSSSVDYRRTSSPSGGSSASSRSRCRSRKITGEKEHKKRSSLRKSHEYRSNKHCSGRDYDEYIESIQFRNRKMKEQQIQLTRNAMEHEREWHYYHDTPVSKKPHYRFSEKNCAGNIDTDINVSEVNYKLKRKRSRRSEKRRNDDKRYDYYNRHYHHASSRDQDMYSNIQFSNYQDLSPPRHAPHYYEYAHKSGRRNGDRYNLRSFRRNSKSTYDYDDDDDDNDDYRHRSDNSKKRRDFKKSGYSRSGTRAQANYPYRHSKKSIRKAYVMRIKGKKKNRREKKRRKYSSSHSSSRYYSSSYSRSVRSSRSRNSRSSASTDRDVGIRRRRLNRSENNADSQQLNANRDRRQRQQNFSREGHSNAVVSDDDWDYSNESSAEDAEKKRERKREMADDYRAKDAKAARSLSFENSNDENENMNNKENGAFDEEDDESSSVRDDTVGHFNGGPGTIINGRYEVVRDVGMGTFGRVVECTDLARGELFSFMDSEGRKVSASNEILSAGTELNSSQSKKSSVRQKSLNVAIKIVRNVRRYYESALIEADILKDVNSHGGRGKSLCVKLLNRFTMPSGHYCLVFECLGMSLYDFLKAHDYTPFPMYCVRDFARQLLDALEFLHSFQLIHTDLKPENILLVSNQETTYRTRGGSKYIVPKSTKIKVIDFGGATYDNEKKSSIVNTRQYRAPEVILDLGWSTPSDLWSAGCIIAELYLGELLFATHDNLEHLALMQTAIGPFPRDMLARSKSNLVREAFDSSGLHKRSRVLSPRKETHVKSMTSLEDLIHTNGLPGDGDSKGKTKRLFVKLLLSLLSIDQEIRVTAVEALQSYFFIR